MKKLFIITGFIFLTACAIAPTNLTNTARTLGENNHQLSLNAIPVLGAVYDYGLSKRVDIGVGVEEQLGLLIYTYAKYNFHNPSSNGFSHAALGGVGYGFGIASTKTAYAGLISSYLHNWFEVFLAVRYNYVHWKINEIRAGDRDDLVIFPSTSHNFSYGQADFGFNFIAKQFTTTIAAKYFQFPRGGGVVPALGFGFKF